MPPRPPKEDRRLLRLKSRGCGNSPRPLGRARLLFPRPAYTGNCFFRRGLSVSVFEFFFLKKPFSDCIPTAACPSTPARPCRPTAVAWRRGARPPRSRPGNCTRAKARRGKGSMGRARETAKTVPTGYFWAVTGYRRRAPLPPAEDWPPPAVAGPWWATAAPCTAAPSWAGRRRRRPECTTCCPQGRTVPCGYGRWGRGEEGAAGPSTGATPIPSGVWTWTD